MTWRPVLNLKTGAESFEQTMKVKMIMERIMKAFLKSKIIYSFKLIYIHVLVSGITSLSVFNEETLKPSFSWASQIFGFEKCFSFHQDICFSIFCKWGMKQKRQSFFKIKLESFKLPKSVFHRLEISMVLTELFVVFLNGIFSCDKWEW